MNNVLAWYKQYNDFQTTNDARFITYLKGFFLFFLHHWSAMLIQQSRVKKSVKTAPEESTTAQSCQPVIFPALKIDCWQVAIDF